MGQAHLQQKFRIREIRGQWGLCFDVLFTQTSSWSFSKVPAEWESPARAYASGRVPGCGVEDPTDLQAHIVAALLGSRPLFTLLQFFHFKDAVNIGKYRLYFCIAFLKIVVCFIPCILCAHQKFFFCPEIFHRREFFV